MYYKVNSSISIIDIKFLTVDFVIVIRELYVFRFYLINAGNVNLKRLMKIEKSMIKIHFSTVKI